jgi:hypothetical protein
MRRGHPLLKFIPFMATVPQEECPFRLIQGGTQKAHNVNAAEFAVM